MPVADKLFHAEKNAWKKAALLFTIPCAILPMLLASDGLLSGALSSWLFPGDQVLYVFIYVMYALGLFLSLPYHRKYGPLLLFVSHLSFMAAYLFVAKKDWLLFASIFSLLLTSVVNQYFRTGSIACSDCCSGGEN